MKKIRYYQFIRIMLEIEFFIFIFVHFDIYAEAFSPIFFAVFVILIIIHRIIEGNKLNGKINNILILVMISGLIAVPTLCYKYWPEFTYKQAKIKVEEKIKNEYDVNSRLEVKKFGTSKREQSYFWIDDCYIFDVKMNNEYKAYSFNMFTGKITEIEPIKHYN